MPFRARPNHRIVGLHPERPDRLEHMRARHGRAVGDTRQRAGGRLDAVARPAVEVHQRGAQRRAVVRDVEQVRTAWVPLERDIRAFVEGLGAEGLVRSLEYRSLAGQPATSQFWEMIAHVVNHGTYHRGQIATFLRQLGGTPAQSTDMIVFFRERGAAAR